MALHSSMVHARVCAWGCFAFSIVCTQPYSMTQLRLGSLTAAISVSFDLIVSCSSCRGQSLINTLKLQKNILHAHLCVCVLLVQAAACTTAISQWVPTPMAAHRSCFKFCCTCPWVHRQSCLCLLKFICSFVGFERRQKASGGSGNRAMFLA